MECDLLALAQDKKPGNEAYCDGKSTMCEYVHFSYIYLIELTKKLELGKHSLGRRAVRNLLREPLYKLTFSES